LVVKTTRLLRCKRATCELPAEKDKSGEDRIRTYAPNTGNSSSSDQSGAESGALGAQEATLDPDLAAVVDAWPALPGTIKAGILAIIRAAK
jgi:hypothetical protein